MTEQVPAMQRIPKYPPDISPAPDASETPLWSVMIPVYNCGPYLGETLASVLQQDPGGSEMQICVVDDASTDVDVEHLVQEIGRGRVEYIRQATNVGSLNNFNTCITNARGKLVHLLHADDLVLQGYYSKVADLFATYPEIGACFTRHRFIDVSGNVLATSTIEASEDGILERGLERIAAKQIVQYVAMTVRREVYEKLGGFYGVTYGEDWEMWARIASRYAIGYTKDTLADYRIRKKSISSKKFQNGQNIRDLLWVMKQIRYYLPPESRRRAWEEATNYYSEYALSIATQLRKDQGNKRAACSQALMACHLNRTPMFLWRVLKFCTSTLMFRRQT